MNIYKMNMAVPLTRYGPSIAKEIEVVTLAEHKDFVAELQERHYLINLELNDKVRLLKEKIQSLLAIIKQQDGTVEFYGRSHLYQGKDGPSAMEEDHGQIANQSREQTAKALKELGL